MSALLNLLASKSAHPQNMANKWSDTPRHATQYDPRQPLSLESKPVIPHPTSPTPDSDTGSLCFDDIEMHGLGPHPTDQDFDDALNLPLNKWVLSTIALGLDPPLANLLIHNGTGLERTVSYIQAFAPYTSFCAGIQSNAWVWFATEWTTPTSLLGQIQHRVLDYYPYVWNQQHCLAFAIRCLLYTSPSPRDRTRSRMPSSA